MRNILLFFLLCCSTCLGQVLPASGKSNPKYEPSSQWKTILWQPDAVSALRESLSSGKPLMVFLAVGFKGQAGADEL